MQQEKCRYHDVCGLNGIGTTDLCVLHTDSSTKKKEAFDEALAAHRQKNGDHFLAFVFPQDVDFSNVSFDCGVDFSEAVFYKVANFSEAVFHEKASFAAAQFRDGVNFGGARFLAFGDFAGVEFKRVANFDKAEFMKGANFSPYDKQRGMFPIVPFSVLTTFKGTRFTGVADFSDRPFQGGAIFCESTFADKADFSRTKFIQDDELAGSIFGPDFSAARFEGEADFSGAEFNTEVAFVQAKFAQVNFSNTEFAQEADFTEVQFEGKANFERAAFAKLANFMSAEFAKRADFSGSMFAEEASFSSATFSGRTLFHLAGFGDVAHFAHAKFIYLTAIENVGESSDIGSIKVSFWHATFKKCADFEGATFGEGVNFSSAKFKEGADFSGASFGKKASFLGSTFLGRTSFVSGQEEGQTSQIFPGVEIDFSGVIIDPLDALTIRDADLQKCKFQGTDLRKAEITNATWPKIPVRSFGITVSSRNGVYDEFASPKKDEPREWYHVERLYRELKQNYEDRRDYERACDFHYGEKEARRKQAKRFSGLWLWLNLYKWVAGYGERWGLPLLWAAIVLLISAAIYICLALHPELGGIRPKLGGPMLSYASTWDCLRSVFYSFRVMTLMKPEDLEAIRLAKLIYAADSLLGPLLLGLFALALRQRLKR
jgi:uncharacterized protein YjbI with pentapeptide repeats